MSLTTMCSSVLAMVGWDALTSFASNPDKTAAQLVALAKYELRSVGRRFDWRHLLTDYQFNTLAGQAVYPLPVDFDKLMQDSVYNQEEYYMLRSSMTDSQWNAWRYGLLGSISHQRYRIAPSVIGTTITISPTPSSVEPVVLIYKSKNYAVDDANTFKETFDQDTDIPRIPEDVVEAGLLWRFRRAKGLDFSAELAEYNEISRTRFAQTKGEGDIPIPNSALEPEITSGYVPDSGFGGGV